MEEKAANRPVSFPTSSTPPSGLTAEYRDSTVTRTAMQAHDAVDRVADSIGPVVDKVKDVASRAGDLLRLRDMRFEELQEEVLIAVRKSVRKNPVAAVSIALAVGWIFGRARSS